MTLPRFGAALLIVAAAALTAACAGSPAATSSGRTASAGVPSSPVPSTASPGSDAAATDPTCETIISDTIVTDFTDLGWTAKEEPFYVGGTRLTGGLQCTWGDYSVPSDHVQVFGWAPITDEQATAARSDLLSTGWREIDGSDALYITENPDTAVAVDDEGYGLTYRFGDGSVTLADTKQGLLLVEWPEP